MTYRKKRQREKHGGSKRPEYAVWTGMISRCTNPLATGYQFYGGRGIDVCSRWRRSFADFLEDVGPRPSKRHSLDRIDPNEGYMPGNVRWALPDVQALNKRDNPRVTYDGRELYLSEWADLTGVPRDILYGRIFLGGWDLARAFGTPQRLGPAC